MAYTRTFSSTKDDTGEQQVSIKSWMARRGWVETWGLLNHVSRWQVQEHTWGWILFSIKCLVKPCNFLPQDVVDVNSSRVVGERCTQTWKKMSLNFFALRNCTGLRRRLKLKIARSWESVFFFSIVLLILCSYKTSIMRTQTCMWAPASTTQNWS